MQAHLRGTQRRQRRQRRPCAHGWGGSYGRGGDRGGEWGGRGAVPLAAAGRCGVVSTASRSGVAAGVAARSKVGELQMDLPTVGLEPRTSEREAGGRGLEPRTSEREAGAAERGGPASPGLGPWSGNLASRGRNWRRRRGAKGRACHAGRWERSSRDSPRRASSTGRRLRCARCAREAAYPGK